MVKGIDVSSYQGVIDWAKVKAEGWQFAILKVIRKDLTADKQFEANWAGCETAGMAIQGVYNYTYATTAAKAKTDAEKVLEILGSDRHPMVWLDYEDASLPKDRTAADIINAYGDVITAGGCEFGIYFGMSYYDSYLDAIMPYVKSDYKKGWEARYYNGYNTMTINSEVKESKKPEGFDGTFFGWQYSSSGSVAGISGSVDLDLWYEDVEAETVAAETAASTGTDTDTGYTLYDFVNDSSAIWLTTDKDVMIKNTVTVSTVKNKNHAIVTPLERYMKALGYYTGNVEADSGKTPIFGNGMKKAIILYQANVVGAKTKYQDGILTAGAATWKKLYE